jgi:hypothetical protein
MKVVSARREGMEPIYWGYSNTVDWRFTELKRTEDGLLAKHSNWSLSVKGVEGGILVIEKIPPITTLQSLIPAERQEEGTLTKNMTFDYGGNLGIVGIEFERNGKKYTLPLIDVKKENEYFKTHDRLSKIMRYERGKIEVDGEKLIFKIKLESRIDRKDRLDGISVTIEIADKDGKVREICSGGSGTFEHISISQGVEVNAKNLLSNNEAAKLIGIQDLRRRRL